MKRLFDNDGLGPYETPKPVRTWADLTRADSISIAPSQPGEGRPLTLEVLRGDPAPVPPGDAEK